MRRAAGEQIDAAFELGRRFRAGPETVFRAWTRPEALKRWWCPNGWAPTAIEVDLRVGGGYRIAMSRLGAGADVSVCGRFLEVRRPQKLVYTWRWEGAFEEMPKTIVTVTFDEFPGGTELTLRHAGFADDGSRRQHRSGWVAACARMDRSLAPPEPATVV